MVEYRLIHAREVDEVLDLWAAHLPPDRGEIARDLFFDPRWPARTFVAVSGAGELLGAIQLCQRTIRDAAGAPQPVAGIVSLATKPAARGQSIGSRLVDMGLEPLRRAGCRWGLLSTTEPGFYTRLGWAMMPTRYRQGMLAPAMAAPPGFRVTGCPPDELPSRLDDLAAIHAAYNAGRPLTVVRDSDYWHGYTLPRLALPSASVLLAYAADAQLCGYVVAHYHASTFAVTEIGTTRAGAAAGLLAAVGDEARRRGIGAGRVYLPFEPEVDAALAALFAGQEQGEHQVFMVRPLAEGLTHDDLAAMYRAPGAIPWPADDF